MSDENRRPRRASWALTALSACIIPYAGCYLCLGETRRDDAGTFKHPATIRAYRSPLSLAFAPAAWVEANLTRRTVVIGEELGPSSGPGFSFHSLVLHKWIVDPGGTIGANHL